MVVEAFGHPTCRCDSLTADLEYIYWTKTDKFSPPGLEGLQRGSKCRKCGETWWVVGDNQDAKQKITILYEVDGT